MLSKCKCKGNIILFTCKLKVKYFFVMAKKMRESACLISRSLDIFGDKWSLLIIRDLMRNRVCSYGDFLKSGEKIATNILATRLQSLEEDGIIAKEKHPDYKVKMVYSLTPKGIDLLPILVETYLWAEKYYGTPTDENARLVGVNADKEAFITEAKRFLSVAE